MTTAMEIAQDMGQLELELRDWLDGLKTPDGIADVDKAIKHWAEEVKKLVPQVESLAEESRYPLIANHAKCHDCKDPVHGFIAPDKLWAEVVGEEIVLCWDCFAYRANKKGICGFMSMVMAMPDYRGKLIIADAVKAYCEAEQLEPSVTTTIDKPTVDGTPIKCWCGYETVHNHDEGDLTDKEVRKIVCPECGGYNGFYVVKNGKE